MIAALVAAALSSAGQTCVVNKTDDWLSLIASDSSGRDAIGDKFKFVRVDIGPKSTVCFSAVSPRGNPFVATVTYRGETTEFPANMAVCPSVGSGEAARLVATSVDGNLKCMRES